MKFPRRQFLHLAAGAAALPVVSRVARAQTFPTRPVRIIVGFTAGGAFDITARLIGQWLSQQLGQQFITENRPGASTNIATEAVVRAPADGYTLLLGGAVNAVNATLYDKLSFDFMRDIAPVAGVMRFPNVMEVNPSFATKTFPEFVAYAKANPGKVNMASSGNGTSQHLSGELFKMMAAVNLVHVPYRGAQEYADRNLSEAQYRDQCRSCRSGDESKICGVGRHGARRLARRFRQTHCRRNREMGQGDQVRRHQTGVTSRYSMSPDTRMEDDHAQYKVDMRSRSEERRVGKECRSR